MADLTIYCVSPGSDPLTVGAALWPDEAPEARAAAWVDASASGSAPATHAIAAVGGEPVEPHPAGVVATTVHEGGLSGALAALGVKIIRDDP